MPQVPILTPSVLPERANPVYQRLSPDTGAWMAPGRALASFGEAVSSFGASIAAQGRQAQNERDAADANNAFISAKLEQADVDANYFSLEGANATDAYPGYVKSLQDIRNKYIAKLGSVKAKTFFDNDFTRSTVSDIGSASRHAATQHKAYVSQQSDARVQLAINDSAAKFGNDNAFNQNLLTIREETAGKGQTEGWSKDKVDFETQKAEGVAYAARIREMAIYEPFRAEKLYNENRDKIDPDNAVILENAIRTSKNTLGVRSDAELAKTPGNGIATFGRAMRSVPAGTRPLSENDPRLAPVHTADGRTFMIDREHQAQLQGFITDYEAAGGVIGPNSGTVAGRAGNPSLHPIGGAIDINQVGRGQRAGGKSLPRDVEDQIAAKWGMRSGNHFSNNDNGHFDFGGDTGGRGGGGAAGRATGFYADLRHFESGNSNVTNEHATTTSGRARGFFQITDGTWADFGGVKLGYKTAQDAPYEVQKQIADKIPMGRWAPETIEYLKDRGWKIDLNKTLAENAAANGDDGSGGVGEVGGGGGVTRTSGSVPLSVRLQRGQELGALHAPNDPTYTDNLLSRIRADYNLEQAGQTEEQQAAYNLVGTYALGVGLGEAPTKIEDLLANEQVRKAWESLDFEKQNVIHNLLEANSKEDVPETPAMMQKYQELRGKIIQADSPAAKKAVDVFTPGLSRRLTKELIDLQTNPVAQQASAQSKVNTTRAMSVLDIPLRAAKIIVPAADETDQTLAVKNAFYGALSSELDRFAKDNKRPPTDDEIKQIGSDLLQRQPAMQPGMIWGETEAYSSAYGDAKGVPLFLLNKQDLATYLDISPESAEVVMETEVPDDAEKQIRAGLIRKGNPNPSMEMIWKVWQQWNLHLLRAGTEGREP